MDIATIGGGLVSNVGAKALEILGKAAWEKSTSWWNAEDDFKDLQETIKWIEARLRDAERRQEDEGGEAIKVWLQRLKLVLYQAEDLFEKVTHVHGQKSQNNHQPAFIDKVFASYFNIELAKEIKYITEELDTIKVVMKSLNLAVHRAEEGPRSSVSNNRETTSLLRKEDVIGRDREVDEVIKMLFDPKSEEGNITVVPIVGFGGLGKTTLAQLVFNLLKNDDQPFDLTAWAYVPEIGNKKVIMGKILASFTDANDPSLSLDQIEQRIVNSIERNKYLLVLDDLWDDDVLTLSHLKSLLNYGKQGSKVMVTTRSDIIAKRIGTVEAPHKLGTLTHDNSMELFNKLAFRGRKEHIKLALSEIGEDIVKTCGNVPLAIQAVGRILRYKETEKEWKRVRDAQRREGRHQSDQSDVVMATLKLSYDYLRLELKQCFAYCSLFPKGYGFDKDFLVQLWMAQGYIYPPNEDIGDEYFSELLERNLFQGPEVFKEQDVAKFKMHDLLHDLARKVAGDEIMLYDRDEIMLYDRDVSTVRIPSELVHLNLVFPKIPPSLEVAMRLRSLLWDLHNLDYFYAPTDLNLLSNNQSLRVFIISAFKTDELPDFIRRLIHLRYLDLGFSYNIKFLPDWIARLENLQTLKLEGCVHLKELPRDVVKLTNLKHLLLPYNLIDLPPGFGAIASLQELNIFIVGNNNGLDSLRGCWNHRGKLSIIFRKWRIDAIKEAESAKLKENHQLASLKLEFNFEEDERVSGDLDEMLNSLQLPPSLKHLYVHGYKGDKVPDGWPVKLSQLVSIELFDCGKCKVLPELSQLVSIELFDCGKCKVLPDLIRLLHLKRLVIRRLRGLEYVQDENSVRCGSSIQNEYFQSLEVLEIEQCNKLMGWTRPRASQENVGGGPQLVFPRLLEMNVSSCPMLVSIPLAPKLESLEYNGSNGKALKCIIGSNYEEGPSSSSAPPPSLIVYMPLKKLDITWVDGEEICSLAFSSRCCNLNRLSICGWSGLWNIRFEHLNSLRTLDIRFCKGLEMEEDEEERGKISRGWQDLTSLRKLVLVGLPKMKKIPGGIFGLTTIEELIIKDLENLTEIPKEIGKLSLLHRLEILSIPRSIQDVACLQVLRIEGSQGTFLLDEEGRQLFKDIPNVEISDGKKTFRRENFKDFPLVDYHPGNTFFRRLRI